MAFLLLLLRKMIDWLINLFICRHTVILLKNANAIFKNAKKMPMCVIVLLCAPPKSDSA